MVVISDSDVFINGSLLQPLAIHLLATVDQVYQQSKMSLQS